ncbi:SNF2 helicase associated domain-containing protein [Jeotgalibaca ciconiae]|uniref:Helicase SNF2 n=1 Tax=Jeotgalibaca ciconiae TaxID=2496265 RepID=A0A3Q9BJ10_9LACT|nr:SNF2 helicase associated domain-containing protein [Jeotgalibaca ciconiae]AZP03494.1 hypothetical protein EJN90_01745 [Jeotgalibaca ciconiae]
MKWELLSEAQISEEASSDSVIRLGKNIFRKNEIKNIIVNEERDFLEVYAVVSNAYRTELMINENHQYLSYNCTCPKHMESFTACKHIVATMYKYNELIKEAKEAGGFAGSKQDQTSGNHPRKYFAAQYIMDHMSDFLDAQTGFRGREKLTFEYHFAFKSLENEDESSVRVKVGVDKLYQVKDIEQISLSLLREQPMVFGKEFSFDPAEHYIGSKDREMLYYLLELKNYQFQHQMYHQYSNGNKSEIEIQPVLIKETLQKILQMEHYKIKQGHRDSDQKSFVNPILFDEGEVLLPIPFQIRELANEPDHFQFSLVEPEKNMFYLFPLQKVMIKENDFFFLTDEEIRILNIVANAFSDNSEHQVVIPKKMMKDFLMTSVPSIAKRFPITISEQVKENYQQEPLIPKMYLDWSDDKLWVNLEFHYGPNTYNPTTFFMEEESLPESMVLDLEGEGKVLNSFYSFDFAFEFEDKKMVLVDFDEVYRFLYDALPEFSQLMEIYTTSSFDQLLYESPVHPQLVVGMDSSTNLLQVTFDMDGIAESDLKKIMQDLIANKKYRRLSNGKIINLQDQIFHEYQDILQKMDIKASKVKREMELPLHKIFSIDEEVLKRSELKNSIKDFLNRISSINEEEYTLPEAMVGNLRPYQVEGFQWLKTLDEFGFGGILADDMGLGKTIQALTFIASTLEKQSKPILVICPSSVLFNWQKESNQFIPGVETVLITGTKEERQKQIEKAKEDKIKLWITSYPVLIRDAELYEDTEFRTVILDEAQIVKNNTAKTTKAVRQLRSFNKFALSGTPLENQLGELYSIFSVVVPGLLGTKKSFKAMELAEINRKISPFILRRLKRNVLKELPDKIETIEYIDFSEEQKSIYLSQLSLVRSEANSIIEQDRLGENRIKILAGLTRLRQICCDPRLVMPDFNGGSAKLERLLEYLELAKENGNRVVLFSQFTQMLAIIQEELIKREYDYFYLDGKTPNEDRLALTTRFNEGEKDLFLISLKAGGTGLNLTGGDTVILYDSWWNPAVESQATDRVHRYGQKNVVQVIRMICAGTIEERISELQDKKRELIDQVISDEKKSITSLSKEEILELLSE